MAQMNIKRINPDDLKQEGECCSYLLEIEATVRQLTRLFGKASKSEDYYISRIWGVELDPDTKFYIHDWTYFPKYDEVYRFFVGGSAKNIKDGYTNSVVRNNIDTFFLENGFGVYDIAKALPVICASHL